MVADRPLLGILLMLGFCLLAPMGDSMAKLVGDSIPLLQILAARFAIQAILLTPLVLHGPLMVPSRRLLRLVALRTLLHIAAIGAMFLSLRYLPIAEAIAIAFVMPFLILLMGWVVLGEEVGPRRLGACAVGFCGTLMVVQPTFAEVGSPALLPLVVAVFFTLFMLVTRHIAKEVKAVPLQWLSGWIATAILVPPVLVGAAADMAPLAPVMPDRIDAALLLAMGILGTMAHLLMSWSLRFAPSATLAPIQYLEIPVATLLGWAIFGDLPNGLAATGIAVTMAAGLYVILRERQLSRVRPTLPAPHPVPPGAAAPAGPALRD